MKNNLDIVQYLIETIHIDPTVVSADDGNTLLHFACGAISNSRCNGLGRESLLKYLLSLKKIPIDALNNVRMFALMVIAIA